MIVAQVIGTVVATKKHELLRGKKIQIVQPLDGKSLDPCGQTFVAIDAVGAGSGEQVLVVQGSGARQGADLDSIPVDATIVGIIDQLDISSRTE